jgi:aminopeptidase
MVDQRLQNMAKILVAYSTKVVKDDWVVIFAEPQGIPLAREIARQATLAGAHVDMYLNDRTFDEIVLKYGSEEQDQWVTPLLDLVVRKVDVFIQIMAPENTRTLSGVDPLRQKLAAQAMHEVLKIYHQRIHAGELRWNITQAPCPALAQEADMSLADFEEFVFAACFADQDDPVACWQKVEADQERLVQWLAGSKEIKIQSANADLTLSIEGRSFLNSTATVNLPSGEIYTSPVEDSANGWVQFTYPAIRLGREVEGVRLEFEKGRVVKASAVKNEEYLLQMLDVDEGARYLGELGIGTNYGIQRFTKSILFDEKIGGTFHLAIGNGFPETGGKNQSSIHWDFICDARNGGRMWADGVLFYQDGRFVI